MFRRKKKDEKTEDAPTTLISLNIKSINDEITIFAEFVHMDNTKLMGENFEGSIRHQATQSLNSPALPSKRTFGLPICASAAKQHAHTKNARQVLIV